MMPEDILEALAALEPLVLHSTWVTYPNYGAGVIGYNSGTMQQAHTWKCRFCYGQEGATLDSRDNVLAHQGYFPHTDECVWKQAAEYLADEPENADEEAEG